MYLQQRLAKILSDPAFQSGSNEARLIRALQALIIEYDCDTNFHRESEGRAALSIPPPAYVQELELHLTYE